MADLVRLGVVATVDPHPEREIDTWRSDMERGAIDDPAETRERLDALDRGEYAIVELHCFAEVASNSSLSRCGDTVVSGCWFSRGDSGQNYRHVSELVKDHLDELCDELVADGVECNVRELASLPIRVELDDELLRALGGSERIPQSG
jgi:hypothetical protein